jgi:hypothetical protein
LKPYRLAWLLVAVFWVLWIREMGVLWNSDWTPVDAFRDQTECLFSVLNAMRTRYGEGNWEEKGNFYRTTNGQRIEYLCLPQPTHP